MTDPWRRMGSQRIVALLAGATIAGLGLGPVGSPTSQPIPRNAESAVGKQAYLNIWSSPLDLNVGRC
jgi:hypothetical protein